MRFSLNLDLEKRPRDVCLASKQHCGARLSSDGFTEHTNNI